MESSKKEPPAPESSKQQTPAPELTPELYQSLLAQLSEAQQKAAQVRQQTAQVRQQTAQVQQLIDQARQKTEQAQQQADQARKAMEDTIFTDFIEHMEDAVFSTFFIERAVSMTAKSNSTKVDNKMYPPAFRPWSDFMSQHMAAFDALRDNLGDGRHFSSSYSIEVIRTKLARMRAIAGKGNVRPFINIAIESPVTEILNAHLNLLHPDAKYSVQLEVNNAYKLLNVEGTSAEKNSPDKDLQPDRWVFLYELEDQGNINDDKTLNILVGECKSPQKLELTTLQKVLATASHDTFFRDAIGEFKKMEQNEQQGSSKDGTDTAMVPGHVLVAQALCQTYHYMVGSGCEYGYITSGDSLVLLRVEDDLTLLYHCVGFPVPHVKNADERRRQNHGQRQAHETAIAYLASLALLGCRSTPRHGHWIQSAKENCPRWPTTDERKNENDEQIAFRTPRGPDPDGTDNSGGGAGGTRGGENAGAGDAGGGPSTTTRLPQASGPRKRGRSPQKRQQSQKDEPEVVMLAQTTKAETPMPIPTPTQISLPLASKPPRPFVVEPPRLPYCTQACLLGLVRGLSLDNNCPNVALHREARRRDEETRTTRGIHIYSDSLSSNGDDDDGHPLTEAMVRTRIVAQIAENMDKDCECTAPHSTKARYGLLFKLAVTDYGYTFVGKGVRAWHRDVLEREAIVYNAVPHVQGHLIPVFLGIIDLERPMPMPNLAEICHLMLMSYAGPDFTKTRQLPKDVNLGAECDRTTSELMKAGVFNDDIRDPNVAWNAEVQRVMHFDFDRVALSRLPAPPPRVKEEQDRDCIEEAAPASRSPLLARMDSNMKEVSGDVDGDGRHAKRMRTLANDNDAELDL